MPSLLSEVSATDRLISATISAKDLLPTGPS
jgi:hypothetical protein